MLVRSFKPITLLLATGLALSIVSCTKDDPVITPTEPDIIDQMEDSRLHTIALAVGSGSSSTTYTQAFTDLTSGQISYNGFGFEVPSSRTARIFSSDDGTSLYDLDYGGGRVYKFANKGGEDYQLLAETNIEFAMGTAYPRWTKVNDDYALLHNVTTERLYDENDTYIRTVATARLMSVNLENLEIGKIEEFIIPSGMFDSISGDFVFRIDAPMVIGDKVYYGLGKRGYDPNTDENLPATFETVETMVVDYPELTNPRLISSQVPGAKGATNGYRTPVSHQDENGVVYQIITVPDNTYDTYILKIEDGDYDNSFTFNLSELLGEKVIANGWFYVGNGIGYVPYANADLGGTGDPVWAVARIDLKNNAATKMNLPANLWLQQYQNSIMIEDKFYMAIAPLGEQGNIYEFDPSSTSPDGFVRGATLQTGADAYYIGIY